MANKPEKDTKEALKPYTEIKDTKNEITASEINKKGKKGFEKRIIVVITIVSTALIKMAFTFRLILPGISPGAFKKAPTTTAGAYLKYPKKYSIVKGTTIATPSRIPRLKLELFKNNSICFSTSFKWIYNLIVKLG
jgi:hypothetical protein